MSFKKDQSQTYAQNFARQALLDEGDRLIAKLPVAQVERIFPDGLEAMDVMDLNNAVNLLWRSVPADEALEAQ